VAVTNQMGAAGAPILAAARSAFVDAWATSMWLSAGLAVGAAVFALVWTPSRRQEHADRDVLADARATLTAERLLPEPAQA
jgi:hypothetical protein